MNTTYEKPQTTISSHPIYYVAAPRRTARSIQRRERRRERMLTLILSLPFSGMLRVATVISCLFGFLGLIGGVEAGVLPVGVGVGVSVVLFVAELLCLKR